MHMLLNLYRIIFYFPVYYCVVDVYACTCTAKLPIMSWCTLTIKINTSEVERV